MGIVVVVVVIVVGGTVVVVAGGRVVVVVLVVVVGGAEIVDGDVRTAVLPRAGTDEHAAARSAITASPIPLRTNSSLHDQGRW